MRHGTFKHLSYAPADFREVKPGLYVDFMVVAMEEAIVNFEKQRAQVMYKALTDRGYERTEKDMQEHGSLSLNTSHQTFYVDDRPMVEFYGVRYECVVKDQRNKVVFSRDFKLLYEPKPYG